MIKIKVEWHHKCRGCGTELVSDFFADSTEDISCPWCGCPYASVRSICDDKLKEYIDGVVKETEEKANGILTARN